MKERLRVVDGRVRIDSTVGSGTKVVVMVPIERQPKVVPSITTAGLVSFIA